MTIDSILKTLGIRSKSLAERINDQVMSGYIPSDMAKEIVGKLSSKRINEIMSRARDKYNLENDSKVFKDE